MQEKGKMDTQKKRARNEIRGSHDLLTILPSSLDLSDLFPHSFVWING